MTTDEKIRAAIKEIKEHTQLDIMQECHLYSVLENEILMREQNED
jgi:hypothetical protein